MPPEAARLPWGQRGATGAVIAASLAFERIGHVFPGGVAALSDVSLAIAPGEILCLLGPSGCGKTTLLRIAAGIERQTEGRVLVDGREIAGPAAFVAPDRRGIGLMFQDYALFPHMTILANVLYGLKSLDRADADRVARQALARVGLAGHASDHPHQLSGGEQQRVALARALAPRPAVLLMDEPFSNLDRRLRDEVREETVAVLREVRATAVVVTHDPEEAMRIADRIALLREGRLVQVGTPEDLYRRPVDLKAARFFCDLTEVEGRVAAERIATPLGSFTAPGIADGPGIACIRPQGTALLADGQGVPGRVARRVFLGDMDLVEVRTPDLDRPLKVRTRAAGGLAPGAAVGLAVDPAEVLVFAATPA